MTKTPAAELAAVTAAESPIRASIAQGYFAAAQSFCRDIYGEGLGRYCMAMLGDLEMVRRAAVDIWERSDQELQQADPARTIRSVLFGLARRRCAYLLETNQLRPEISNPDPAKLTHPGATKSMAPQLARRLLARLRPSEREILILRYVCGLTYAELGGIWGVEPAEARLKVSSALVHANSLSKSEELRHG